MAQIGTHTYYPDVAVAAGGGDDGPGILTAWQLARGRGGALILDAARSSLSLSGNSLVLSPNGGATADLFGKILCINPSNGAPTINYSGSDTHAIKLYGLKHFECRDLHVRALVANKTLLWVATRDVQQSFSNGLFQNCLFGLYANGCTGVSIGADADTDGGVRDISGIQFVNTNVSLQAGKSGVGSFGYTIHSQNVLNLMWTNCYLTGDNNLVGWSFENDPAYTVTGAGGNASTLINCGGSFLGKFVRMATGYTVNVHGGRSELCGISGRGVFEVGAGSATQAGLNVNGHVSESIVSGAFGAKSEGATPVVLTNTKLNGTLYNQSVANGTLASSV